MPFCTRCGSEYPSNASFCPACGVPTTVGEIAPAAFASAVATAPEAARPADRPPATASASQHLPDRAGFPAAARSKRIVAGLIDLGIVVGFILLLLTLPSGLRAFVRSGFVFRILSFTPGLYLLLRDSVGGHSVGKLIVGLVVIDTRSLRRAGLIESIVRNWPLALVGIPTVGWVIAGLASILMALQILMGKKQRFMDGSATTQVIEERLLIGA